jgi:hypothetical protein
MTRLLRHRLDENEREKSTKSSGIFLRICFFADHKEKIVWENFLEI